MMPKMEIVTRTSGRNSQHHRMLLENMGDASLIRSVIIQFDFKTFFFTFSLIVGNNAFFYRSETVF